MCVNGVVVVEKTSKVVPLGGMLLCLLAGREASQPQASPTVGPSSSELQAQK